MRVLFFFFAFTSLAHAYECKLPADAKKVMLFIDTNGSLQEIETAQESACKRGETFVVFPKPSPLVKEVNAENARYTIRQKKYAKDCKVKSAYCDSEWKELDRLYKEMNLKFDRLPKVDPKVLDAQIALFRKNNVAITTAIFSGHNGGGSIAGITGRLNKTDFFNSMNRHYGNRKDLKDLLHSVLLWGCYTSTPEEIMEWKANFPNLKILAGFNGIAPANTRAAGTTIMKDLLSKDKNLTSKGTPAAVKRAISDLKDLQTTHSGVYVNSCDEEYYYNKDQNGTHFKTFDDMKTCSPPKLAEEIAQFQRFFSGDLEHDETEMRRIYDYARKHDHCFNSAHPLEGDHVALLLFFKAVKFNFKNIHANLLAAADAEFKNIEKTLSEFEKKQVFRKSPEDLQKLKVAVQKAKASIVFPTKENLEGKPRKEILAIISTLEPILRNDLVKKNKDLNQKLGNLLKLQDKMQTYLYQLKPACMDFLDWHERNSSYHPPSKC